LELRSGLDINSIGCWYFSKILSLAPNIQAVLSIYGVTGIDRSQRGIPKTHYRSTKFSSISLMLTATGLQKSNLDAIDDLG
jgi:hypothetical protein